MAVFCQKKMQFPRSVWTILNTPGSHSVGDESPWGGFWLMVLAQPAGFWTLPSWVEWPPRPGQEGQLLVRFLRRWGSAFLRKGGNAAHFLRSGLALNGMFNHICLHLDGIFQRQAEISQWVFFRVEFFWKAEGGTLAAEPIFQMKCPCVTVSKLTQHIKLPQGHSQGFSDWCFSEQDWKRREVCRQTGSSDDWYSGQLWAPGVEPHRTNLDRITDGLGGKGP